MMSKKTKRSSRSRMQRRNGGTTYSHARDPMMQSGGLMAALAALPMALMASLMRRRRTSG